MPVNKLNLWLGAQTLGVGIFAARFWPLVSQIRRSRQDWSGLKMPVTDLPPATVIVPARNEERNIERCVCSLLKQDYPDYELIVVDDGSTDGTPAILARLAAKNPRLKVLTLREGLPEGWAGKPHAMQRGYEAARPESRWVLFSDADTEHHTFALSTAIATAIADKADLLSVMPRMELKSFWEEVLMPFLVAGIMLQYPLDEVNKPHSRLAIANGQFLLVRREYFEKVGGYGGRLKNSLLDDRDMALAIKSAGGKLVLKNGEHLLSVRMYTSLGEIWRGFRKNAFLGSRSSYLTFPFFIIAGLVFGVFPLLQLAYALVRWSFSGGKHGRRMLGLSLLQLGLTAFIRRRFDRELDVPAGYSLLTPLTALVVTGILVDSMVRSLTGRGLSWKDRNYTGVTRTQQMIR